MNFCSLVLVSSLVLNPLIDGERVVQTQKARGGYAPADVLESIGISARIPLWLEERIQSDVDELLNTYPTVFTEIPDPREELSFIKDLEDRLDRIERWVWVQGFEVSEFLVMALVLVSIISVLHVRIFDDVFKVSFGVSSRPLRYFLDSLGPAVYFGILGFGIWGGVFHAPNPHSGDLRDLRQVLTAAVSTIDVEGSGKSTGPVDVEGTYVGDGMEWGDIFDAFKVQHPDESE